MAKSTWKQLAAKARTVSRGAFKQVPTTPCLHKSAAQKSTGRVVAFRRYALDLVQACYRCRKYNKNHTNLLTCIEFALLTYSGHPCFINKSNMSSRFVHLLCLILAGPIFVNNVSSNQHTYSNSNLCDTLF